MNKKNTLFILTVLLFQGVKAQFNTIVDNKRHRVITQEQVTEREKEVDTILAIKNEKEKNIYFSLPLDTLIVTSCYGYRNDPFNKSKRFHKGLDLKANSSYVYSVMPGRVIKAGHNKSLGNYVEIQHGNFKTLYAHMSQILINKKSAVSAGQKIGITGSTGRSTGEHLHFAVKYNNSATNPQIIIDYINRIKSLVNNK